MSRGISILWALLSIALASCSGSQHAPPIPPAPAPDTRATLAGPLCDATRCQCTDDPAALGKAPEGFKRFKVELGPTQHELWGSIDGNVFYKSVERAKECFYVDLEAGEHAISVRAKGAAGFGARLQISELGGEGPWLYSTFEFSCGAPGLCDKQALRDWKQRISRVDAGKHAPCGSVRVLGLDWQTGRMPDNLHPEDFYLQATMKVYEFQPRHPPGTDACIKS